MSLVERKSNKPGPFFFLNPWVKWWFCWIWHAGAKLYSLFTGGEGRLISPPRKTEKWFKLNEGIPLFSVRVTHAWSMRWKFAGGRSIPFLLDPVNSWSGSVLTARAPLEPRKTPRGCTKSRIQRNTRLRMDISAVFLRSLNFEIWRLSVHARAPPSVKAPENVLWPLDL